MSTPGSHQSGVDALRGLVFRPERSRPVWRNIHTGATTTVVDLAVNDHGGFQSGCRQFVVITDEPGPPGPPSPPDVSGRGPRGHNVHALESWLRHWEPVGEHVDWDRPANPTAQERWKARAVTAETALRELRGALEVLRDVR